ncbi:hypothetical protein COXBURSA331_A0927 [Coxiella burnetii RSA 331]|nr:hypothetical protein COXBURSA331_A0927 [Coxiella burnetii RSA 331]
MKEVQAVRAVREWCSFSVIVQKASNNLFSLPLLIQDGSP